MRGEPSCRAEYQMAKFDSPPHGDPPIHAVVCGESVHPTVSPTGWDRLRATPVSRDYPRVVCSRLGTFSARDGWFLTSHATRKLSGEEATCRSLSGHTSSNAVSGQPPFD